MLYIFDEIFFDYNYGEFCSTSMMTSASILQQLKENRPKISVTPEAIEFKKRLSKIFHTKILETFLPSFGKETIIELEKNISFTICGLLISFHSCFHCPNLLEQMTKMFLVSDRYIQVHKAHFPDIESIEPIPVEVGS